MDAMVQYQWPGNIRQLEHSVQQMVAMNSGPWIGMADFPSGVVNGFADPVADKISLPGRRRRQYLAISCRSG